MAQNNKIQHSMITDSVHNWNTNDEKFKILFENVNDGVILLDKNGTVIGANNNILNLLDCHRRDILGKDLIAFFFIFDIPSAELKSLLGTCMEPSNQKHAKCILKNKKGESLTFLVHQSFIKQKDRLLGSFLIFKDISGVEFQLLEKIMEQREIIDSYLEILMADIDDYNQEILQANDSLLSKIESIEDRISINHISDNLDDGNENKNNVNDLFIDHLQLLDEYKNLLQISINCTNKISCVYSTITKVLKLYDIELSGDEIDATKAIIGAIERIKYVYNNRNIIEKQPVPTFSAIVKGNELLSQIFDHILCYVVSNSEDEEIVLDINIIPEEDENYWKFEIKTNGPNIPDDRIFQTDMESEKKDLISSGLVQELSVVNEIVKLNGGKLLIENIMQGNVKEGSVLTVLLPRG